MSVFVELLVRPFALPDTVAVELPKGADGKTHVEHVPLWALTPGGLSRLCDEFRQMVFEKAGMADPHA